MATFQDMISREHVKGYLQKAIELNRVAHAYMLSAESGYGKKTLAEAFAMTLQCEKHQTDACLTCASCKKAISGNHPDIIHVTHAKPGTISVDEIREQVNKTVAIKPYTGPYKIYIIPDAELMTVQAQNALLKTIEEPPEYVVLLLLVANEQEMLPTIISRCVNLRLRPVSTARITQLLMEQYQVPDYKAAVCASFAQGNPGKAVRLATSENYAALKEEVISLVQRIHQMALHEIIDYMKKLSQYKLEIHDFLDFMAVWYRDVLLFKATKDTNTIIFTDRLYEIIRQADRCSYDGLESILRGLSSASDRLDANVSFDLTMELLFMMIKENS